MAKRGPQSELTDRNWDEEEEPEECGVFKQATAEAMQQRVVKKAKRRVTGDETGAKPSAFGGFGGFMKSSNATTPLSTQSGMAFGFKPSVPSSTTSVLAAASKTTESSSTTSKIESKEDNSSSYLQSLKALNESVLAWIKQHVEKNPYIILTPIFKDYEKHYESLKSNKTSSNGSSPSNGNAKTEEKLPSGTAGFSLSSSPKETDSKVSAVKPFSFGSTIASNLAATKDTDGEGGGGSNQSKPFTFGPLSTSTSSGNGFKFPSSSVSTGQTSNLFNFGKSSTSSSLSSSSPFGTTTTTTTSSNSGFSFGGSFASSSTSTVPSSGNSGFSFGSNLASSSTSTVPSSGNSGFSFGVLAAKAMSESAVKDKNDNKTEEDDEYVPPKPEVKEIQEEGSLLSKRCKLFYQKEGEWTERGVGNVHIKPLDDDKTQLLIRADTNLGNILLNINVTSSLPVSRQGKNNVMLVSVPNPPLKEGSEPKPISMLIRVKTGDEADELLAKLEERKNLLS